MKYTVEQLIELAQEVELGDSIDWDDMPLEPDRIYQIIGSQVCEYYNNWAQSEEGEAIMLSVIIKLLVENFVLNLRLKS